MVYFISRWRDCERAIENRAREIALVYDQIVSIILLL